MTLSDYSGGRPSRVILLWQKISGQWVNDQYLLYREQKLTKEQFKQISVAWLAQHAVNIDVKQALASIDATIVAREAPEKPHQTAQPSVPTEHEVTLNPQSGTRQLWPEIAARYSLTPLGLLALNPQFNARPDTLKVGDKLCVTAAQPQRNTATSYAAPPIAPQIYNHPANVFYDYSADYLKGSQQLRPIKSLQQTVANSIPVLRVANWDEEKACWLELQAAPHAKYIIEPAEQATSTPVTGTLDTQGFSYITLPDSYENKAVNIKLIPHSHYGWNDFLHDAYAFFRIGAGAIMLVGAAGASATGVGTVVGVGLASMGADQIITGFKSVYTRQEETSLGAQALQLLGVPEEYAELAYDALPLGAGMLKIAIPSLKGIQVFTQSGSQQIVSELHLLGASIRQKLTVQWGALSGTKGNIKVYGPHDIGPLGDPNNFRSAASTFRSGTYMEKTAETEIYFYRDYGGKSKVNGRFWTIEPSKGPLQSMLDSAVLPEWGNTFNRQAIIKIPKGTKYFEGAAAAQKGTVGTRPKVHGGGTQIFLPEINKDWIIRQ